MDVSIGFKKMYISNAELAIQQMESFVGRIRKD